jgi:hypothetical protein
MPNVAYAEYHKLALNAECHYPECRYAECHCADCRGALMSVRSQTLLNCKYGYKNRCQKPHRTIRKVRQVWENFIFGQILVVFC